MPDHRELIEARSTSGSAGSLAGAAIRAELERILNHSEFQATDRIRRFLRFIVEETLSGRADQLKGYNIAIEVFGRGADFDANLDPVVRIQARHLRQALERYYLITGTSDAIRIDIPKGAYVPVFTTIAPDDGDVRRPATAESWPSVLVNDFQNLSGDPDFDYLGAGLATELCLELARYPGIRVFVNRGEKRNPGAANVATRFRIDGSTHYDGTVAKVMVQLIDTVTGEQSWSDQFCCTLGESRHLDFQENTAHQIALHVGNDRGVVPRRVANQPPRHSAERQSAYHAVLKYWDYDRTLTPKTYSRAFEALTDAVAADMTFAPVLSMLALMYSDNICLEFMDLAITPLDQALEMAQRSVRLESDEQLNQLVLGRLSMLAGDQDAALAHTRTALELNPNSLCYLDVLGYHLMLLGEFDQGREILHKTIRLNPFYRDYIHYGFWVYETYLEDYEEAYRETDNLRGVGAFWDPLARAATLGQLGRIDEGREAVVELLACKPDFAERGRILIKHSVKIDEVVRRIIEGLSKVGLCLDP